MNRKIVRKLSRKIAGYQLSPTALQVRSKGLTYLSTRRLFNLEKNIKALNAQGITGDILEFGVALGGSGILLSHYASPNRRYFGFDVFGMIPSPNPEIDGQDSLERYNVIATGKSKGIGGSTYYGYEQNLFDKVRSAFDEYGFDDTDRYRLLKGLFETEWPKVASEIRSAAFVHIDCDWHDPVQFCLEVATAKLVPGGIVIVDDYNDYEGAKKAVRDFLAHNRDFRILKNSENLVIRRHA